MGTEIQRAAVLGAGVMGSGIAAHLANAGIPVILLDIVPPALLILAVLGSIFAGIATVTEASGIGALGATLLAVAYRRLNFGVLKEVTINCMNTSAYIFAIFLGATIFALVLRELGGDELIESALTGLGLGPYALIAVVLLVVFLLGFFLDWIEISLIILPLLGPVVLGLDLDINGYGTVDNPELVWFALLVAVTLQTSFLTPPVGANLFVGMKIAKVSLEEISKSTLPFILTYIIVLLLLVFIPQISLFLPNLVF